MDQLHEEASQPRANPLTQEQITVQVLGKRSGYLKGFRVGPKPSSAFNSTTRSHAHDEEVKGLKEEVALLKGIIQSYEGRFEQFEHSMRQMQGNRSGYNSFDDCGDLFAWNGQVFFGLTCAQWFFNIFVGFLGKPIAAGIKMIGVDT